MRESFETSIIQLQKSKLNLDEKVFQQSSKISDLDHKVNVMRKDKDLLNERFTEKQIMVMITESKPMFENCNFNFDASCDFSSIHCFS